MKNAIEQLTRILAEKRIEESEVAFVTITPSDVGTLVSVTLRNIESVKRFENVLVHTLFDSRHEAYFDYYEARHGDIMLSARVKSKKATASTVTRN